MSRRPKAVAGGLGPPMSAAPRRLVPVLAGVCLGLITGSKSLATEPPSESSVSEAPALPPNGFYAHFGPGALLFSAVATVKAAGAVIPGGTVKINPNETLITEFGYRWRSLGISLTGGYPPLAAVDGAGSLTSLGTLGRIRYGPTVLTIH